MTLYSSDTTSQRITMIWKGGKSSGGRLLHLIWCAYAAFFLELSRTLHAIITDQQQDSTLTRAASGNRYPKDADDWTWLYPSIPGRLKNLDAEGAQVVIISNQAGISLPSAHGDKAASKKPTPPLKAMKNFKGRLNTVMSQLDFPVSVYAATARDQYRKPRPGMWHEVLEHYDLDDEQGIDREGTFYVGDAAGRTADGSSGNSDKDFASSDRDFAANAGIDFMTPEEFFLQHKPRPFKRLFDPGVYLDESRQPPPFMKSNELDIVVLCGSPGAGKSTYYRNVLEPLGYARVNQDILKSRDKCLKVAGEQLQVRKSVAVDNTNADAETRSHWLNQAKRFSIPARCVLFKADPKLCEHNASVRALNATMNPEKRESLPQMAFGSFLKRFQPPTLKEGFQDITVVEFSFRGTPEQRAIWSQYHV